MSTAASSSAVEARRSSAPAAGRSIEQAGELRSARVESLRAVAALSVFVSHVYVIDHHLVAGRIAAEADTGSVADRVLIFAGGMSIYLFLVLSGYLLFWPFVRRDFGGGGGIRIGNYAINRVLRVLPLYFISVAVLLILKHSGGSLDQWLAFGTFTENFSTDYFTTVNGVLWSVVVEIHFYMLLPFLALFLAWASRGDLRRAALILAALGLASFALRYFTFFATTTSFNILLRYSLPSLFMYFCFGMLLAYLRLAWERNPPQRLRGRLGSSELWIVVALAITFPVLFDYRAETLIGIASFLVLAACVLPLRPGRLVRLLEWRVLATTGVVSYSLYVWHLPLVIELDRASWMPFGFTPLLLIATAVVLAVSFASYGAIERPFLRLRRRWSAAAAPAKTGKDR